MRSLHHIAALLLATSLPAAHTFAQERTGPIAPPPKRDVKRIPVEIVAETPPIPAEEILRRFVEKEDANKKAFDAASYQLNIRLQEYDDDGGVVGEAQVTTEIYLKPDGTRVGRVISEPRPTLKRASNSLLDLQDLAGLMHFPLTSDQLEKYDLTYAGREQVDEISTFIFRVRPKQVDRRERRFEGVIWVDDQTFEVVKTYGKFISEVVREDSFTYFESYRQPVSETLRFPIFVRSEGALKLKKEDVPLRLTLRYSEFKLPETKTP